MAKYYCRGGGKYNLVGPSELRCLADGSWDLNPPACLAHGEAVPDHLMIVTTKSPQPQTPRRSDDGLLAPLLNPGFQSRDHRRPVKSKRPLGMKLK